MPIVQAYECPRSRKLFKDKAKYVRHLKILAYKNFKDCKEGARLTLFKNKFEDARKTVRSFAELALWIEEHARDMNRLAVKFGNIYPKFALEETPLSEVRFEGMQYSPSCSNERRAPRNGITNYKRTYELPYGYAGTTGLFKFNDVGNLGLADVLQKLWPIHFGGGGARTGGYHYECTMFAEDWPFIGCMHLRVCYAESKPVDEDQCRILRYAFPGISEEHYVSLHCSGLLPTDAREFADFMFQYVEVCPANAVREIPELPTNVAFD